MTNLSALNLGGADKKPETPPSGPADSKQPAANESKEVQAKEIPADGVYARFSSHPIQRFGIGEFHFENGLLEIRDAEREAEFRKLLEELPLSERHRIQEIDVRAAEELARAALANSGAATKSIDSSTGDRGPQTPVGKGKLGG